MEQTYTVTFSISLEIVAGDIIDAEDIAWENFIAAQFEPEHFVTQVEEKE